MATDNFQNCLAFVLKFEGGKSNDPHDPGGRTMEGVTQATYDAWLRKQGRNSADVFSIPAVDRNAIYRGEYWNEIKGDLLQHGEDLVVFDLAVNSGPNRALQIWREAAVSNSPVSLSEIIERVCSLRLTFLQGLKTWQFFGSGWAKRVMACHSAALKMASEALPVPTAPIPIPIPVPVPQAPVPAPVPIPQPPPSISPTAAGRQAAVLDQLMSIRDAYDHDIAELQRERGVIDQSIQAFSGFLPPPMISPPPPVQADNLRSPPVSSREEIAANNLPPKPALSSTTIWGGLISVIGPLADFGLNFLTTNNGVPGLDPKYNALIVSVTSLIGGAMAIWGRNKPEIAPIKGIISSK